MSSFTETKIEDTPHSAYKWYIIQTSISLDVRGVFSQDDRQKAEKLKLIFHKTGNSSLLEEIFVAIEEKKNPYTNEMQYTNLAPGYVFIKVILNDVVKALLLENQNKIGFIMGGYAKPHQVPQSEIDNMKKIVEKKNQEQDNLVVGDMVKITHRDFTGFQGVVTEIVDDQISVTISIFGRNNVIKCSIKDVERTDETDGTGI